MAAQAQQVTGWRAALPAGVRPYTEGAPHRCAFPRYFVRLPLRHDRRDADHAAQAGRHRQVDDHRLHARLPRLQLQVPLGLDHRRRADCRSSAASASASPGCWSPGVLVIAAVANLALVDPAASIESVVTAAILVGIAGATFDIVIDAYRIEILEPRQLGVGSGMSQYGWRIGSAGAGAHRAGRRGPVGWEAAYLACAAFALPAMLTAPVLRRARAAPRARRAEGRRRAPLPPSGGRSPNSSSARARCSCCSSSCSTRSATRWRT